MIRRLRERFFVPHYPYTNALDMQRARALLVILGLESFDVPAFIRRARHSELG